MSKNPNAIIDAHRAHLAKVQEAFNKRCEAIGAGAQAELDQLPEDDTEGRQEVLKRQQGMLDKTLAELKSEVVRGDAEVRRQLEEIENQNEKFDLKNALQNV